MDGSGVRGKIQKLQAERDAAVEHKENLEKRLKAAEALEQARQSKLSALLQSVEMREADLDEQNERLERAQGKVGHAVQRMDECEQELRRLMAEEFFRKKKAANKCTTADGGKGSLLERTQAAEKTTEQCKVEMVSLKSRITELDAIAEEHEEREIKANYRTSAIDTEIRTLASDILSRERQRQATCANELKLEERIKKCCENLEAERKRVKKAEAEILRLEAVIDEAVKESESWKKKNVEAISALAKAQEELQDLMNC